MKHSNLELLFRDLLCDLCVSVVITLLVSAVSAKDRNQDPAFLPLGAFSPERGAD